MPSVSLRQRIIEKARGPIRELAIKRVKAQIAQQNRRVEDFSEDELEDLVAAAEGKIRNRVGLWGAPVVALAAFFGL